MKIKIKLANKTFFLFLFSGEDLHIQLDKIKTIDVLAALERTKPSAKTMKQKYIDWQKEYESV